MSALTFQRGNEPPVLRQFSTLEALAASVYDGFVSVSELKDAGNFGIGTYHAIDGESVLFNDAFYQIRYDGSVVVPPDSGKTPFASVVDFVPAFNATFDEPLDFEALEKKLDALAPCSNTILAIHVHGYFTSVRTRSSYAQKKPYPDLVVAMEHQPKFDLPASEGDLIGFRLPPYLKGLNIPGYHFHYLDLAKKQGGHVLNFKASSCFVEYQEIDRFEIILPPNDSAFYRTDLEIDRTGDIQQVEGAR